MKKLIFSNFLKDNLKNIAFFGSIISIIIWTIQGVNYLDFITNDGHSIEIYLYYSLLNLPKIIERILPFIFFISLFLQLQKYELNNELLIFWSHGINYLKFINILIIYSLIICFIQILLSSFISPKSQDLARSFIRSSNIDYFPNLLKENKFLDISNDLTIYIEKKIDKTKFQNIILNETLSNDNIEKIKLIHAKEAELINSDDNKRFFRFFEGSIVNITDGKITDIKFDEIIYNLDNIKTKTTTYKKIQETEIWILLKCLKNIYMFSLVQSIEANIECNRESLKDINQEINKRLFKPLYIPFLCLICSLLIFTPKNKKMSSLIFFSTFFILVYSEIFVRYSGNSIINFSMFLIMPLILFIIIYFYIFFKIRHLTYKN